MTLMLGTAIGGAFGTFSSLFFMWFLEGELWQYSAVGAGIGCVTAIALSIWIVQSRTSEDGDASIDITFPLKLIIAMSLTGAVCAGLDTWWNGQRFEGGIVSYMVYTALFGAVVGLVLAIYWSRKEKKLPLRDELMLAHEDELDRIDRETCRG